ncbi:MAG: glycoside hydrolase family 92 protein [Lentisphaeria bacterium]|nr:glycoside hydrolase family 92 protein [Lentisphaeria bacterium]
MKNFIELADPFWGNGPCAAPAGENLAGHWNWLKAQTGNTHPGALMPFGWVSVLPFSGAYSSGYGCNGASSDGVTPQVSDRKCAYGFSHFHTSGTGFLGEFYNYFLIQIATCNSNTAHLSELTDEVAHPGYYSGKLVDYGVDFELTANKYAAYHRCRLAGNSGKISVDTTQIGLKIPINLYREEIYNNHCVNCGDGWVEGFITANGVEIFFALKVIADIRKQAIFNGIIEFDINGSNAESIIAFSLISTEEARNRAEETRQKGFDNTRKQAENAWENILSKINATLPDAQKQNIFYSALYHSLVKPVDAGCEYTDFQTMWDIYRTQLPLMMMIAPEEAGKMLRSMIKTIKRVGFFPCAYLMSRDYRRHDMQATALAVYTLCDGFFRNLLTPADYPELKEVFELEFAHASTENKSPTHILDLAGAAHAAYLVATTCHDDDFAALLQQKSQVWRTAYDRNTGLLTADAPYYEGTHWNYSFRPHCQMDERIALAGGRENFEAMLDKFFGFNCTDVYDRVRPMIPHRFEGMNNESDMETPAAYLWCGRADKQAEIHQTIRRYMFLDGPGGCPGNNDSGGLSSWYVLSCLGLYPLTGTEYCLLTTPEVSEASIDIGGKILTINVERETPSAIYPAGYEFNGRKFSEPYMPITELHAGGILKFTLSDQPQRDSVIPDWL